VYTKTNANQPRIKTIYMHLTHACNLHCTYCYFNADEAMDNELSLDELDHLFKDIALLAVQNVVFTGGEPLLRADIFDIAQVFREADPQKQIRLCLISNGLLVNEQTATKIARSFDEIRISLDGPAKVNNILRGEGTFEGAIRAIHSLKNEGVYPGVSITLTADNLPHLSTFLTFLLEERVTTDFHLVPFRPVGRGAQHPELSCSLKERQSTVTDFCRSHFGVSSPQKEVKSSRLANNRNCGVGSYINILPDGSVYPCHVLSVPEFLLGNLRQTKLSVIVQESSLLRRLRDLDFTHMKGGSNRLRQLLDDAVCLGEVYRDAPEEVFPLSQ
jgi:MoaA/NifB/PqqE/SkfB family radical SAM enzyme